MYSLREEYVCVSNVDIEESCGQGTRIKRVIEELREGSNTLRDSLPLLRSSLVVSRQRLNGGSSGEMGKKVKKSQGEVKRERETEGKSK